MSREVWDDPPVGREFGADAEGAAQGINANRYRRFMNWATLAMLIGGAILILGWAGNLILGAMP